MKGKEAGDVVNYERRGRRRKGRKRTTTKTIK